MLTRQKILLWFRQKVRHPTDTKLMKLMFLTKIESSVDELTPFYDFMPYQFGPFSYIVRKDIRLADEGVICDAKIELTDEIMNELTRIFRQYGQWSQDKLMEHVYNEYPYFAIRSKVKARYLRNETQLPRLRATQAFLNTIHYEERSIDTFINKLINKKIDVLVDVRRNPVSMKYGFRKGSLERYAEAHGFGYLHLPELGIEKEERDELNVQNDYEELFDKYEKTTLKQAKGALASIEGLILGGKRVALLCFEKEPSCCHRTRIANKIANRLSVPVCHL
jgi:uncharacterized protein (DUF488 family)